MTNDFVHLHLHTEYSLLDGACRIDRLVDHVKNIGQKAVAITDHGVMYGCVDFYKKCKKEGIKPIIGCEVYVSTRGMTDKVHRVDGYFHLVLLCKNKVGYQNLIKLVSHGFIDGFYTKPRIDHELLKKHSEGLICLSACLAGEIPRALVADDIEKARELALFYKDVFKDDFYIELQDHGIEDQQKILPKLISLARELDIEMVATNDCHYIEKADSKMQYALICVQTNKTLMDTDTLEFETEEFYVKTGEEMYNLFGYVREACENTVKIAEKCDFDYEFGVTKLPKYKAPDGSDNYDFFVRLCNEGLRKNYKEITPEIQARLDYEISVISKMGFVNYYLIVYDFINYAKTHDIPVGPGRGSGAASLCAYCMGITSIDPLKYNLLFERFLNPERVSMPDFDVDFCYEKRQQVIDYVIGKYGADHVAQIITFGTMLARGAIRDIARVLTIPYSVADKVAKLIPNEPKMTIEKALKISKELQALYDTDAQIKDLMDLAIKVEGMPRHASTHAAGVVITDLAAEEYVPLQSNEGQIVTQFPMTTIEELGLLKMDFLGLRTLTVIDHCAKMVKQVEPDFDIDKIPHDDKKVFEMLTAGETTGVFQFESEGMRNVMMRLKPVDIEDLIAVISLYRPGPMDSIPTFIANRHDPSKISYEHPILENILNVTNGCIVYQEQVMQICREMAGYSYGQADIVRRAMGKKKADVMEKERGHFIEGCKANGVSENIATHIFNEMTSFASYAFNKAHAAAYAFVSYQTAYLKAHYPKQFMAAMITSIIDNSAKILEYTQECQRLNIAILPPDINKSFADFTVEGDNIRYGLAAIKNVGKSFVELLCEEREQNGDFHGFYDCCKRMATKDFNKRAFESLVKVGAFDMFPAHRRQLYTNIELVQKSIIQEVKGNLEGQIDLFEITNNVLDSKYTVKNDYSYPDCSAYTISEMLTFEKSLAGIYLSGHPLDDYKEYSKNISTCNISQLTGEGNEVYDNTVQTIVVTITKIRNHTTKNNDIMSFVTVEDLSGTMDVILFPKVLDRTRVNMLENDVVIVKGRVSLKDDSATLIGESIMNAASQDAKYMLDNKANKGNGLYIRFKNKQSPHLAEVKHILSKYHGIMQVYFYFEEEKAKMLAPDKLWVYENSELDIELKNLLGDANVAYKR